MVAQNSPFSTSQRNCKHTNKHDFTRANSPVTKTVQSHFITGEYTTCCDAFFPSALTYIQHVLLLILNEKEKSQFFDFISVAAKK
jgi:hypothetical protein